MTRRTNEEWLLTLQQPDHRRSEVLADLREYLFRAVLIYLRDIRTDLADRDLPELRRMAEDFAQDALISILENLHKFRGESRFTTWAYRFVINRAIDELRRKHYQNVSLESLLAQELRIHLAPTSMTSDTSPDITADREDLLQFLARAIKRELNDKQRAALIGIYLQDLSIQEMALLLNSSPNTIYKMLHDARKKLRKQLLERNVTLGDALALFEQ